MKTFTETELKSILDQHKLWVDLRDHGGERIPIESRPRTEAKFCGKHLKINTLHV